ncbi:kinase domain protein [Baffinella frigidus]|nr:kinase domain protein [Cryptophyta sp. CCMP2293]
MFQQSDAAADKDKDKEKSEQGGAKAAPPPVTTTETGTEAETPTPQTPAGAGPVLLAAAAPVIGGQKAPGNASKPAPLPNMKTSGQDAAEVNDDTVYYDCFDLKIVYERNRTGFEETKDYPIDINGVIAGRYQILEFLGAAAFSKAVQCVDLTDGSYVCIKIIKNNKDFFDQSLDEIKILKYINAHDSRDEHHLLQLYDYFYFKEHLFIVTELLRDNLYEFSKFNRESGAESYFTMARLQKITTECLVGLKFVHSLGLIHCDLKPENVLIRSYSRCEIKVIDFGSSCFVTDHLTSYVQSRSYRAPEVILGLPYDQQIDMWSLGCILAELWTGRVLFQNDSLATLLARVVGILGNIEEELLLQGRYTHRFFTKHKILYDRLAGAGDEDKSLVYIFPKKTTLKHRLGTDDALFVDFIGKLLTVNPSKRFSAAQALDHPWLAATY